MKSFFIFVGALLTFSKAWDDETGPTQRYLTVYRSEGVPEVIDTEAAIPSSYVSNSNVKLYLYTKKNRSVPTELPLDAETVSLSSRFDSKKTNVFIIHGWINNYKSEINTDIKNAYLSVKDVNVFVVDWSQDAMQLYTHAFSAIPKIGKLLGYFISELQDNLGIDSSKFVIVGHSLGAHLAGVAGAAANKKVSVIVGLDPAGPLYLNFITSNRLDSNDAEFVQVIHTNTGNLGYNSNCGTVDFRPNGGEKQPGCILDAFGYCSHGRAHLLFAESVASGGFTGYACESYKKFINGECYSNARASLGGATINTSVRGTFYLNTADSSPYSLY